MTVIVVSTDCLALRKMYETFKLTMNVCAVLESVAAFCALSTSDVSVVDEGESSVTVLLAELGVLDSSSDVSYSFCLFGVVLSVISSSGANDWTPSPILCGDEVRKLPSPIAELDFCPVCLFCFSCNIPGKLFVP